MGTSNPARQDESFGGVARNIAENLARLGAPVGADHRGRRRRVRHAPCWRTPKRPASTRAAACAWTAPAAAPTPRCWTSTATCCWRWPTWRCTTSSRRTSSPRASQQRAGAALTVADLNLPHRHAARRCCDDALRDGVPLVVVAVSQPKMDAPAARPGRRAPADPEPGRTRNPASATRSAATPTLAAACAAVQAQGAQDVIVTRGAQRRHATPPPTASRTWMRSTPRSSTSPAPATPLPPPSAGRCTRAATTSAWPAAAACSCRP